MEGGYGAGGTAEGMDERRNLQVDLSVVAGKTERVAKKFLKDLERNLRISKTMEARCRKADVKADWEIGGQRKDVDFDDAAHEVAHDEDDMTNQDRMKSGYDEVDCIA